MRPDLIVMLPPLTNDDFRFDTIAEPLHRQALIAEFAVETLRRPILPRLTRIDQRDVEILAGGPFEQGFGNEFRAVVRAQGLGAP